jgi:ABC-type dipeptide/oligopeptide/nickel transport system permease component
MIAYTIRRLLWSVFSLALVVVLIFVVMRAAPGDPTLVILGDYATPEAREALRVKLGLNDPLYLQFLAYLRKLVTLDFGNSLIREVPIRDIIVVNYPHTLALTLASMAIASCCGILAGILASRYVNTGVDYCIRALSAIAPSMPAFYMGILLILLFGIWIPLFPSYGGGDHGNIGSVLYHLVLPASSLGLVVTGFIARIVRSSMLDVASHDFVVVARAKGLPENRVRYYIFRNSIIPVITIIGLYTGTLLGGAVLTESVFGRPGLGRALVTAVLGMDYPTVEILLALFAVLIILLNLLVDLTYAWLDPRISYH